MNANEKHEAQLQEEARREEHLDDGKELLANGKNRKNNGTRKVNKLWLWFGIIILIFILLYWLWTIGLFEDIVGITNG